MTGWRTRVAAAMTALVAAGSALVGCSSTDSRCESLKTATAVAVPGVVSAEFSCKSSFSGSSEHGSVVVAATTKDEATSIMEQVLRAFAGQGEMVATWRAPSTFSSQDGSIVVKPSDVGFNGLPWVSDLRDHYNIHPAR